MLWELQRHAPWDLKRRISTSAPREPANPQNLSSVTSCQRPTNNRWSTTCQSFRASARLLWKRTLDRRLKNFQNQWHPHDTRTRTKTLSRPQDCSGRSDRAPWIEEECHDVTGARQSWGFESSILLLNRRGWRGKRSRNNYSDRFGGCRRTKLFRAGQKFLKRQLRRCALSICFHIFISWLPCKTPNFYIVALRRSCSLWSVGAPIKMISKLLSNVSYISIIRSNKKSCGTERLLDYINWTRTIRR